MGTWIKIKHENQPEHIKCSKCGAFWAVADHAELFKYCFNCGEKMDDADNCVVKGDWSDVVCVDGVWKRKCSKCGNLIPLLSNTVYINLPDTCEKCGVDMRQSNKEYLEALNKKVTANTD